MTVGKLWRGAVCFGVVALVATAQAQFTSAVVGFEDTPIDDPGAAQHLFQLPEFSGTTANFIVPNDPGLLNNNSVFRGSDLAINGLAALRVEFSWVDATDPDGWLRLTTFEAPELPNPSLHLDGKVQFQLNNRGDFLNGEIGVVLGVRETGIDVAQLDDGGTSGPLEWVGVDPTVNGIVAGADGIVDTVAAGDDVQVHPVGFDIVAADLPSGTAVIAPGNNGVIDTTPSGDDAPRAGYFIDADGDRRPIPAVSFLVDPDPYTLTFDLAAETLTVEHVFYYPTPQVFPVAIAGFTGDGVLAADNNRGTFEHLAITNVAADSGADILFSIDELQFEAPVADPVRAPSVAFPIVAGDTTVTVRNLVADVDRVTLLRNGGVIDTITSGLPDSEVEFTIAPALTDDVYTATQRSGQSGTVSPESTAVTVVPDPPPHTFALLVDEGGTGSCTFASPGWEWVNVTGFQGSFAPNGASPLVIDDAVWQVVDIPLDDNGLIDASLGGDGSLAPSPSGVYTIDSVWFSATDFAGTDTWEVLLDSVQALDAEGNVLQRLLDFEDGVNRLPFTRGQSPDTISGSGLFADGSFAGASSHRLEWAYDGDGSESVGILQRVGGCATAELIDDSARTLRFYMVIRGQPTAPGTALPVVEGPLIGSVDAVTVAHDAAATNVALYVNGVQVASTSNLSGSTVTFSGLAGAIAAGDSVSAKQVVAGITSDFAYPRGVALAPPPIVPDVLVPSQTAIELTGLIATSTATAELVTVYADNVAIGSIDPAGATSVSVPVSALQVGDAIQATQTVNGVEGELSAPVVVAVPGPTVVSPLDVNDTSVTVTGVHPLAEAVTVYVDAVTTSVDPAGAASVDVTVSPLAPGDIVAATQTIAGTEGTFSNEVFVANNVFINELNWDDGTVGAQAVDDFEFVELYNGGLSAIDISGYQIDFGDDTGVDLTEVVANGTILQPGEFFVLGDPNPVANLPVGVQAQTFTSSTDVGDGQDYIALRSPTGVLLDAVAYELNKGSAINPPEILTQIGTGIWGNHRHDDQGGTALLTSISRARDGLDTDENGRDFIVLPATPGTSNEVADITPYFEDANAIPLGSVAPDWVYSFVGPVAIDPTSVDAFNLNAIPASPDGGRALTAWDNAGGGNSVFVATRAQDNFTLEMYVYIAPTLLAAGLEETKIGILGRNGAFHNIGGASDATGLVWRYDRSTTGQSITLADYNDGGADPITIGSIDIGTDPALTGWQRLFLEARGDQVIGIFGGTYGSLTDGERIVGTHASPGPGGIYIGYRETPSGTPSELRPPTFDAVSITLNNGLPIGTGDGDDDGDVDLADIAVLQICLGETADAPCSPFDMDGDGSITVDDALAVLDVVTGP